MVVLLKRMTPELAACVLEGLLLLHEELSVDPEAPWYVGTPDQTQVLHDELWILAGEITPTSSASLVAAWYAAGRSSLLPVAAVAGWLVRCSAAGPAPSGSHRGGTSGSAAPSLAATAIPQPGPGADPSAIRAVRWHRGPGHAARLAAPGPPARGAADRSTARAVLEPADDQEPRR